MCVGKGAGVHQWNLSMHDYMGVLFVLFSFVIFSNRVLTVGVVALRCSDCLRPHHFPG